MKECLNKFSVKYLQIFLEIFLKEGGISERIPRKLPNESHLEGVAEKIVVEHLEKLLEKLSVEFL